MNTLLFLISKTPYQTSEGQTYLMIAVPQRSISTQLTKVSVGIALMLGVILSLSQILFDFKRQNHAMETTVKQILFVSTPSSSQAVLYLNQKLAQSIVDGLARYDFIVEAIIVDEKNELLASSHAVDSDDKSTSSILSMVTSEFYFDSVELSLKGLDDSAKKGMLKVKINRYIALYDYQQRSLFIFLTGLLRALLFSIILLWVFRRLLGQPLQKLVDDLHNMDIGYDKEKHIQVASTHQHDELGQLSIGINQYADLNRQYLHQITTSEQSAKINEKLYRDVAESAADWFWEMDKNLCFINISKRLSAFSGFTPEELSGKTLDMLMAISKMGELQEMDEQLLSMRAKKPFRNFKCLLQTKTGNQINVSINGKPILNTDGDFLGYRGTGVDLTQEFEAQKAKAQSQLMLSSAARIAHIGYAVRSGNNSWRLDSISHEYAAIFGYSSDEFSRQFQNKKQQLQLIQPEDQEQYSAYRALTADDNLQHSFEYHIVRKDQKIRHIIEWSEPLTTINKGEQQQFAITIQDITEIKQVEQKLIETENRFTHLFQNSMAAMATVSTAREKGQIIISCNTAFASLYGYQNQEDVYQNFRADDHWVNLSDKSDYLKQLQKHGELSNYEIHCRRLDGSSFWAAVSENLLPEKQLIESVIIDISERKRVEAELKHQYDQTEILVQQRTAELSRINEEQKSFSYSVSHDLRAPLRAIHGFSSALINDYYSSLDDLGRDYLNRICAASNRMSELINSLLLLSHLSRQEMVLEEIDLVHLINATLEDITSADPKRKVKISIQDDLHIVADRGLIQVVFMNLLTNAWKFTQGQDQASIQVGMNIDDNKRIYYVRDNGVGFDMKYANQLFGEFKRLHKAEEFSGIGIGLATAKRIITRHNGKIWVESAINKGATFYFTFD